MRTCLLMILLTTAVVASVAGPPAAAVDYATQVKPILAAKCIACHGALRQRSGLRLDAASLIRDGGDGGPIVVPGNPENSVLLRRVSTNDLADRMPPEGEGEPLTVDQIATLRAWIEQGLPAPDDETVLQDPRLHWAYQPLRRSRSAEAETSAWGHNLIDSMLANAQRKQGLSPGPPATKATRLRRVYFNLIGLPPTRQQLQDFLADPSPRRYEQTVDALLASPLYGQHWGRHWMDVWRYSDWSGYGDEIRYSQKHIWRWRDWIVESLNRDQGYDRMIVEMLAGDELSPGDENVLRATGFLARNWYKFDRNSWLDDTVDHTSRAFLGLTMKCARCHDHKYDPISQREYYNLRAVFEPYEVRIDRVPGELDVSRDGLARVYDAYLEQPTYLFERGDPKRPRCETVIAPGVPAAIGNKLAVVEAAPLPWQAYYPTLRPGVTRQLIAKAGEAVTAAAAAVPQSSHGDEHQGAEPQRLAAAARARLEVAQAKLRALDARLAADRARYTLDPGSNEAVEQQQHQLAAAAAAAQHEAKLAEAEETYLNARHQLERAREATPQDDAKAQQAAVEAEQQLVAAEQQRDAIRQPADGEQHNGSYEPLGPTYPNRTTGRRLALARWIVDADNPLTARVAVNHIWLRHFGEPLVERVDDFGLRSPRPPLADLLDYLAGELIDSGWSTKHIHRLITTSSAYQLASSPHRNPPGGDNDHVRSDSDPDNQYVSRMNLCRVDAESVRDAILYLAGQLDLSHGGPDIPHTQGFAIPRRSLYFQHARERQMQFLKLFDVANPIECYRRQETIRPQQAFALINSELVLTSSRHLAARLSDLDTPAHDAAANSNHDPFIRSAFETILSRGPSETELAECLDFLNAQATRLANTDQLESLGENKIAVGPSPDPSQRARENLVLVLFNHNDFVTIR